MYKLKFTTFKNLQFSTWNWTRCQKIERIIRQRKPRNRPYEAWAFWMQMPWHHGTLLDKTILPSSAVKHITSHFQIVPLVFEHHLLKELGFGVHKHRHTYERYRSNAGGRWATSPNHIQCPNIWFHISDYPTCKNKTQAKITTTRWRLQLDRLDPRMCRRRKNNQVSKTSQLKSSKRLGVVGH